MATPLELLQSLISNPTSIEHVRSLTTADVTYVSLNFDNPELHSDVAGRTIMAHRVSLMRSMAWPEFGRQSIRGQRRNRQ